MERPKAVGMEAVVLAEYSHPSGSVGIQRPLLQLPVVAIIDSDPRLRSWTADAIMSLYKLSSTQYQSRTHDDGLTEDSMPHQTVAIKRRFVFE
jgi:hypothetical protein